MNPRIRLIDEQRRLTRNHTLDVLKSTPFDIWYETPKVIESNIAWQVGHLIVSQYYHSIVVITGPNKEVLEKIPIKEYIPIYSMAANSTTNELKPKPETLMTELQLIDEFAGKQLAALNDEDLDQSLVPTRFKHPIAKTKYEALTWSFRHEMWHLGQLSTLKRILGNPVQWW